MVLAAEHDFVERLRRWLYPALHEPLARLGDKLGLNLYATGTLWYVGYAGTVRQPEDVIEVTLEELGAERNPIACFKRLKDGRRSEGSWCFRHEDHPELIEEGMQIHVTLFETPDGNGRELHAHYEDDWRINPLAHLRAKNFSYDRGVALAQEILVKSDRVELTETDRDPDPRDSQ